MVYPCCTLVGPNRFRRVNHGLNYRSGHTALSPDDRHLVLGNLRSGFDIYEIPSHIYIGTLSTPSENYGRPLPVVFHHKSSVLTGSTVGKIRLWNIETCLVMQTLRHREQGRAELCMLGIILTLPPITTDGPLIQAIAVAV